jgi:hypothetical protein
MKVKSIIAGMIISIVVAMLVGLPTIRSAGVGEYDPWADVNNDGKINILDITKLAICFGTSGTPFAGIATLEYDSGWIDIADRQGQYITVTHGLNITDLNDEKIGVDIAGKTSPDGELLRNLGLTGPAQGWNRTYGNAQGDFAEYLVQTTDGGYAIAGYTYSLGAGASDFWLIKTDASGNEQWNKTYGGTKDESAYYIIQTADGGYALTGVTTSFGGGFYNAWFVKTDAYGNMEWNKTYSKNPVGYGDWADAVVQTTDGGYALACWTDNFGAGYHDFWLIKTDANGNAQWNKTYGGSNYDVPYGIVQTGDGGYALGGASDALGNLNFWLLKTDANGNQQWNQTYGGTGEDAAYNVVQTSDGGYALSGRTNSFGAGSTDFWLVKTDASGDQQWNKTYGGTGVDLGYCGLVQTHDGGYALAGWTNSFGAGNYDFWLVKTDEAGNAQWNKTYGGTGEDRANGLIQTADGGYAIVGYTLSFGAGNEDAWVIKTDAVGNAKDGFKWYGLACAGFTPNTIRLFRGTDDEDWNYVRIQIWKKK